MALNSSANACALVRFRDRVDGHLGRGAGFLSMSISQNPGSLAFQLRSSPARLYLKTARQKEAQASKTRPVSTCTKYTDNHRVQYSCSST